MIYLNNLKSIYKKEGFQKYFKNTSWLFLEKIFRIFVSLIVGVWVARYLGPADYGAFQYAFSFVSIFVSVATLGLDHIVVRELVKDESRRNALLGTTFVLKILGGAASIILLFVTIQFTSNELVVNKMILVIGASALLHSFNVIDYHFQSKVISQYVVYANFISMLLSAIVKVIFILTNAPLIYFALVVVFESIVLAAGFIYYYTKTSNSSIYKWKYEKRIAVELLSDSWPLIFGGMILMVQARIDQVMLKEMSTNEEVGYYSVSLRMVEMLGFIPMLLQSSLLPSLINTKKVSLGLYKSRLLNYYRLNFIFFLVTALPIYFFSDWIILFLYDEDFAPAIPLLAFMAIRIIFANMGVARTTFINIENLFKFSMFTMLIGTVVNIALNYYFIPDYLSMGAIFSTIVSFTVTIFVVDLFYKKTRGNVLLQFKAMLTFYAIKLDFLKK